MKHVLQIPGFGNLVGRVQNGIAHFQNVKFGHVANRFESAQLYSPETTKEIDCTSQGPLCPQKQPFNDDFNGVPREECAPLDLKFDDHDCLNMWLQIPEQTESTQPLPVVIWLHGGSNIAGSPYRGSSRAFSWLARARQQNKPFIFISAHYRVGLFGWLPWGTHYNQSLGDQRLAIEWVRKYGRHFNADISRITLVGQSAGASNTYAHVTDSRTTSLVAQIGLLSGHIGRDSFATRENYAALAERIAKHLDCRVEDLATIDWRQIVRAQEELKIAVYAAIANEESPPRQQQTNQFPRLIVGDCERDAHFMADVPSAIDATPPNISTVDFFTDIMFRKGANEVWKDYAPKVFRQLCDGRNPYTPSFGNNHMVELHYIINGYNIPNNAAIEATQDIWTQLVHMEDAWDPATQAFWIPFEGKPQIISAETAWGKRQLRSEPLDKETTEKLNRKMRGW